MLSLKFEQVLSNFWGWVLSEVSCKKKSMEATSTCLCIVTWYATFTTLLRCDSHSMSFSQKTFSKSSWLKFFDNFELTTHDFQVIILGLWRPTLIYLALYRFFLTQYDIIFYFFADDAFFGSTHSRFKRAYPKLKFYCHPLKRSQQRNRTMVKQNFVSTIPQRVKPGFKNPSESISPRNNNTMSNLPFWCIHD